MTVINTADALYLGGSKVKAADAGPMKVWPFGPDTLLGLAVWLDASQLGYSDGDPVDQWPNLANPALPGTIIPGPQTYPPTVVTQDIASGLPVVHFLPNQGSLVLDGHGVDLDYTCVFVARMVGGNDRIISADINFENFLLGWVAGQQDAGYSFGYFDSEQTPWTTDWKLYSSDCTSDTIPTLYSDGALIGESGNDPGSIPGCWNGSLIISGLGFDDGTQTSDCEVGEFILYDRKLPDTDRQNIEGYLRAKWFALGLPPSQIPGLLYWADPTKLTVADGDPVVNMPDSSGNRHYAVPQFGPSPTLAGDALRFPADSSTQAFRVSGLASTLSGRTAFSVLAVVNPTDISNYPIIFTAPTNDAWYWVFEFNTDGGVFCGVGNSSYRCFAADVPLNAWSVLLWTHDNDTERFFINDTEITAFFAGPGGVSQAAIPAMTGDVILGGYYNDQYGFVGDLGEVLIYDHALPDTARQQLMNTYLRGKWLPSSLDPDTRVV